MNLNDLDFETVVDKVVVTGGKDGCVAHIHYKGSDRVDCRLFVKQSEAFQQLKGVL